MRYFYLATIFFAVVITLTNSSRAETPTTKKIVKIGVIAPLTGGDAQTGVDVVNTLKLQTKIYNELSTHYQYELLFEDGKCGSGPLAATAARKFIDVDRVNFLITNCSGETLSVAPLAEKHKVVQIASWSSHKDVKTSGDYVFRTFVDIERGILKLTEYLRNNNYQRVAMFTEDIIFTVGLSEILKKSILERVVSQDLYTYDTVDFRTLLSRAKSKKPDAYFFAAASTKTTIEILKQAKTLGLKEQLFGFYFPEYPEVVQALGSQMDGLIFLGHPEIENACPDFIKFFERWKKEYPQAPQAITAIRSNYDAFQVLFDTVEKVGTDSTTVKNALYQYSGVGAQGPISFDQNGDIKDLNWVLKEIKGGKPIELVS